MLNPPIAFADVGAQGDEHEDVLAAFELALSLGATGLASRVWVTADGDAVLHPTGVIKSRFRRTRIAHTASAELPSEIVAMEEVPGWSDRDVEFSLDPGDAATVDAVMGRSSRPSGLWICWSDLHDLVRWRKTWPQLKLVYSSRLGEMSDGPERLAAQLSAAEIDAVRLPYPDWSGGLTTLFHRFEVLCVGRDVVHDRMFDDLLGMGIDAIQSSNVDRMINAFRRAG